jgi:uncharacterized membrane protein
MTARLHLIGRRLLRPLARRSRLLLGHEQGERGVIYVMAALVLTLTITSAALALDVAGRVTEVRRDQATADLAALDAVRNLPFAQVVAAASARRNGVDNTKSGHGVTATLGEMMVVNGQNVFSAGRAQTAVQVTVTTPYNDFLGGSMGHMVATASATNMGMAGFAVGATLVDINAGLGKFGAVSLPLVGYNGLAAGTVTLGALATKLGFAALTADQVLAQTVTVAEVVNAGAALLGATSPSYASLMALGTTLAGNARNGANPVQLGSVLGLTQGSGVGLGASVNLLQALVGSVELSNTKAGLSSNFVLAGLPLNVAGASFGVTALVPPTIVYGPLGITATNTQVTVNLTVDLNVGGLGVLGLSVVNVHLPMTVLLGGSVGTLKAIDCTAATPVDIKLGTAFPAVSLVTGAGSASLLGINLGTVTGPISIVSNSVSDAVLNFPAHFTQNPVSNLPVKALSNLGATAVADLTGTGLTGLLTPPVLNTVLDSAMPLLVTNILASLTTNLAVSVGSADYVGIRPPDPQCAVPKLAK